MLDIAANHGGPRHNVRVGDGVEEGANLRKASARTENTGEHGVVRAGVPEGHSVEQVAGEERQVVEKVGSDEGIEGNNVSLRHRVENFLCLLDAPEAAIPVDEGVGTKDGRSGGGAEAQRREPHEYRVEYELFICISKTRNP